MKPRSTISLAATFAVGCALAAFAILVARFDKLPEEIPVTRWGTVAKSVPIVLRIPAINLVSIGLIGLLARATLRVGVGTASVAVLFVTAGLKALLESLELAYAWPLASFVVFFVVVGVLLALHLAKDFWRRPRPELPFEASERWIAVALCAVLAILQFVLPAFS